MMNHRNKPQRAKYVLMNYRLQFGKIGKEKLREREREIVIVRVRVRERERQPLQEMAS